MDDDASSDGVSDEGSEDEHVATRAHFFSRTLGDGWLEVEPGIYLQRDEVSALEHAVGREESLDDALSGALSPGAENGGGDSDGEHDEANGRLRRWLHR